MPHIIDIRRYFSFSILTIALFLAACVEEEKKEKSEVVRPVRVLKVADVSNFQQRWFSGRATGTQEIDLSFRVAGTLTQRKVDVGTEIKKGDVIALIDPATYRADVSSAKANLAVAKASLTDANEKLEKKQTLVTRGVESAAALDTLKADVEEAKATVQSQKATLERKELDLSYTTLRAPFNGIIVKTHVENFQDVQANQSIVRLVDNSKIEMTINIPENLISQAYVIKKGIVKFDALPDLEIPAFVSEIGTEASETTRTYPITIVMEQPKGAKILPGMAGRATADRETLARLSENRIIVPTSAILTKTDQEKTYVWIFEEAKQVVSSREVKTAGLVDQGIVIERGLKPGEFVVTAGVNFLSENQKVRRLEEN
ncbi:MAG: efflux RND transporter periplasmic adaptor subunit [Pseudomonadota bacterium]